MKNANKPQRKRAVSTRQRRYAELVATGTISRAEAARQAGYAPSGARKAAYVNDNTAEVVRLINAHKEGYAIEHDLTVEMIISDLKDEALNGDSSASRVRAWGLLGKYLGMFLDRTKIEHVTSYADELEGLQAEIRSAISIASLKASDQVNAATSS